MSGPPQMVSTHRAVLFELRFLQSVAMPSEGPSDSEEVELRVGRRSHRVADQGREDILRRKGKRPRTLAVNRLLWKSIPFACRSCARRVVGVVISHEPALKVAWNVVSGDFQFG